PPICSVHLKVDTTYRHAGRMLCPPLGGPYLTRLPNVHLKAGERKAAGGLVDDVHLTRVEAWPEAVGGGLELEKRPVRIGRVDGGALDDRRLEHFDLAAVEGQARLQLRRAVVGRRIVDLVVDVQLLIAADDVREVGDDLGAVADERARALAR